MNYSISIRWTREWCWFWYIEKKLGYCFIPWL